MPMMPFRGVRSSWLTLLMKRSFCSSSRFSSSISFCTAQHSRNGMFQAAGLRAACERTLGWNGGHACHAACVAAHGCQDSGAESSM
eukprot:1148228-Pelagomonas_calceolata.AAC.6